MRLGIAALTLAVGLGIGVTGIACADDTPTGNWFTNLFARPAAKAPVDADLANKDDTSRPPPSNLAKQWKADLLRRQDVCDRLRAIAEETGDEELTRLANQLDERAGDMYLAAKNRRWGSVAEPEAKKVVSAKGDRE